MKQLVLIGSLAIVMGACETVLPDTSEKRWACFDSPGSIGDWIYSLYPSGSVRFEGQTIPANYVLSGVTHIWYFSNGDSIQLHPNNRAYHFYGEMTEAKVSGWCEKRGAW